MFGWNDPTAVRFANLNSEVSTQNLHLRDQNVGNGTSKTKKEWHLAIQGCQLRTRDRDLGLYTERMRHFSNHKTALETRLAGSAGTDDEIERLRLIADIETL